MSRMMNVIRCSDYGIGAINVISTIAILIARGCIVLEEFNLIVISRRHKLVLCSFVNSYYKRLLGCISYNTKSSTPFSRRESSFARASAILSKRSRSYR